MYVKVKQSYPRNRSWRPIGLRDVKDPTLLDNRITDCGKVVSPTDYFSTLGIHLLEAEKTQGLMRPEGLGKLKHAFIPVVHRRPTTPEHPI
jgi:hypothetical protein